MAIKIIKGKKYYPVGLFNRLNHVYDMFVIKYISNQIPQNEANDRYYEAIQNVYDDGFMYYAQYQDYKVLKNLIEI